MSSFRGGASPVNYEIAKGYVKLGYEVSVVTMGFKGLPSFEIVDGIKVYRVRCLRKKKEICNPVEMLSYIINAKRFLKKHLKENKYDINHTHFIIPTGIVSLWVKNKFDVSYIITSHGSDIPGYNVDRFKFLHQFTKPILKKIIKNSKKITTPSIYLKKLIEKNVVGHKSNKIIVIPNGSKSLEKKKIKKENIIISSGRLLPRKGFQYLIKAFNELNLKDWKLYIIGDGPYKKELEKLSEGNKNIIFTGWLDNSGNVYIDLFNKAKIFALFSNAETQGIVFLEAMSTGCAILSSNISACKETVTKDVGYLIKREDISDIKNNLLKLITSQNLLNKLSKNSKKRYKENYQWKNIIKIYNNLLGNKKE